MSVQCVCEGARGDICQEQSLLLVAHSNEGVTGCAAGHVDSQDLVSTAEATGYLHTATARKVDRVTGVSIKCVS